MRIQFSPERLFAGSTEMMSFIADTTPLLWRSLMPLRKSIPLRKNNLLYSLQVYEHGTKHFSQPELPFRKFALVEVTGKAVLPPGLVYFSLPAGTYAIIEHVGGHRGAQQLFQRIFTELLPAAGLEVDDRPFFEELDEDYLAKAELATELIWIPVRKIEQNQAD